MLKWNLRNDRIEGGQWIEARVHVDRSDISPDGELVAAFVASYRRKPGTWAAISRPPFFTALAVWPKGDTWGGGGLFGSDTHFFLWHDTEVKDGVDQFKLMDDFVLPKRFRVQPFFDTRRCRPVTSSSRAWCCPAGVRAALRVAPGAIHVRRTRDHGAVARPSEAAALRVAALAHVVRHPACRGARPDERNAARPRPRRLGRRRRQRRRALERGGCLFRLAGPTRQGMALDAEPKLVADLNDMRFEAVEAPKRALRWP